MSSPALSTRIKLQLNGLLHPIGLRLETTASERAEKSRFRQLEVLGHWNKTQYDQGLKLDPQKHMEFLRETCLPYKTAYAKLPRVATGASQEFYLDNGNFRGVDAELLYSVVRKYQPRHIIEVGSGYSTRLMALAIREGNQSTALTSIDPEPRVDVDACVNKQVQSAVEHLDPNTLLQNLDEGDILFIDSSHQVVTGGDVPYLFLEVLPRLKKGVLIHIHDVFLPFDYPVECFPWSWAEQYLVHAFLSFNSAFEILWPGRYMWSYDKTAILDVIPTDPSIFPPSSLWLRKTL